MSALPLTLVFALCMYSKGEQGLCC